MAAKLGAKRVDLYEAAEVADVARKLLRHNRLADRRIAQVHSTDVASPERVDARRERDARQLSRRENIIARQRRAARPQSGGQSFRRASSSSSAG